MGRGAVLDDTREHFSGHSADFGSGCQKLQEQAIQLFEEKLNDAGVRLNRSVKALTGREIHLKPAEVNTLVGITSFALGALAAKEERAVGILGKLGCLEEKSSLPALALVDTKAASEADHLHTLARGLNHPLQMASTLETFQKIADSSALKLENHLDSVETSYSHGISTVENFRGQKWLHQEGYARVPIHKNGADWWREQNLTWVKTSHYLETRNDDGTFFRTYKNGAIQIRFGNGYEVYEGSFPERRKIVLNSGKVDCRAQQQGILSAEGSDLENSLKETGR